MPGADWIRAVQRLAGNQAVVTALGRLSVQRAKPAEGPMPGRLPSAQEQNDWDDPLPRLKRFLVLREPASGYNCFAWAVGITSSDLTFAMLEAAGYGNDVDGFTKFFAEQHGFGRSKKGLHEDADLILYGDSETQVLHAARRADEPYEELTFTSKLGGQNKSPVIQHAPAQLQGGSYGRALQSFWLGS